MLDAAQELAVKIDKNAVVSAGAGSGKTRVLAERFAHLVLEKHLAVDEILTLTFTKKQLSKCTGAFTKRSKSAVLTSLIFTKRAFKRSTVTARR